MHARSFLTLALGAFAYAWSAATRARDTAYVAALNLGAWLIAPPVSPPDPEDEACFARARFVTETPHGAPVQDKCGCNDANAHRCMGPGEHVREGWATAADCRCPCHAESDEGGVALDADEAALFDALPFGPTRDREDDADAASADRKLDGRLHYVPPCYVETTACRRGIFGVDAVHVYTRHAREMRPGAGTCPECCAAARKAVPT